MRCSFTRRRACRAFLTTLAAAVAVVVMPVAAGAEPPPSSWYKADLHVHSAVSGDALQDIGIMAQATKALGYNAIFLTDHTATSNHEIGGVIANHIVFDDDLQQWTPLPKSGVGTPELVTSPVSTGTQ